MEPLLLLRGVREVSLLANPDDPGEVTQRAFDATQARNARDANVPAARQIAAELRMPWRDVLALAHEPETRQARALGLRGREWAPEGTRRAARHLPRLAPPALASVP